MQQPPLFASTGALLGAMTLLRELDTRQAFTEQDGRAAERFARLAVEALDASRIATVTAEPVTPETGHQRTATWRPLHPHDPTASTDGRNWASRTLPEILTRPPRRELYEDIDLGVHRAGSNAVRHGASCAKRSWHHR
jgi:hypothetical protein